MRTKLSVTAIVFALSAMGARAETYEFDCESFVQSFGKVIVSATLFKTACASGLNEEADFKSYECASMRAFDVILEQQAPLSNQCLDQFKQPDPTGVVIDGLWERYFESNSKLLDSFNRLEDSD